MLPRQKALEAIEASHANEDFRNKLTSFYNRGEDAERAASANLELAPFAAGPFKEGFSEIIEEITLLNHHVTNKYNSFKKFVRHSEMEIEEHQRAFTDEITQKE